MQCKSKQRKQQASSLNRETRTPPRRRRKKAKRQPEAQKGSPPPCLRSRSATRAQGPAKPAPIIINAGMAPPRLRPRPSPRACSGGDERACKLLFSLFSMSTLK